MDGTMTNTAVRCSAVVVGHSTLEVFVDAALRVYEVCTPTRPPSCFALLLGEIVKSEAVIHRVAFGRNVRATDATATEEFKSTIVPCFGNAYGNEHRGFWCDSADLLRIQRAADADDLDIIGSIHLHPDWHRIGPVGERGLTISEAPTPMDSYMFRNTLWPVNMICYLERPDQPVRYILGAWSPPLGAEDILCPSIPIKFLASRA